MATELTIEQARERSAAAAKAFEQAQRKLAVQADKADSAWKALTEHGVTSEEEAIALEQKLAADLAAELARVDEQLKEAGV